MAIRYKVVRQSVRFCKKTYRAGELLPESFSERDLYRVLYPSRIEKVNIAPTPPVSPLPTGTPAVTGTPVGLSQGVNPAKVQSATAPLKPTGASLSGAAVIQK